MEPFVGWPMKENITFLLSIELILIFLILLALLNPSLTGFLIKRIKKSKWVYLGKVKIKNSTLTLQEFP